jgi:transcriptional repressor NrdR
MKLVAGLRRAVVKRPVTAEAVENLVESLERNLMDSGEKEVEAAVVGAHVLEALRELDPVAYVRFASVYREFADLDQFVEELKKLRAVPEGSGDDE